MWVTSKEYWKTREIDGGNLPCPNCTPDYIHIKGVKRGEIVKRYHLYIFDDTRTTVYSPCVVYGSSLKEVRATADMICGAVNPLIHGKEKAIEPQLLFGKW